MDYKKLLTGKNLITNTRKHTPDSTSTEETYSKDSKDPHNVFVKNIVMNKPPKDKVAKELDKFIKIYEQNI
jgi:hypothetical protein